MTQNNINACKLFCTQPVKNIVYHINLALKYFSDFYILIVKIVYTKYISNMMVWFYI